MGYLATLKMADGKIIRLNLFPEYAPNTVNNFVELANQGYYDGLIFHRIIDGFMIQAGGYWVDGNQLNEAPKKADLQKAKTIKGEFRSNGFSQNTLTHEAGVLSMARTNVKDSASAQFFICSADAPHLDGEYAAFGKTADEESLKNVQKLAKSRTGFVAGMSDFPYPLVEIESLRVEKSE